MRAVSKAAVTLPRGKPGQNTLTGPRFLPDKSFTPAAGSTEVLPPSELNGLFQCPVVYLLLDPSYPGPHSKRPKAVKTGRKKGC